MRKVSCVVLLCVGAGVATSVNAQTCLKGFFDRHEPEIYYAACPEPLQAQQCEYDVEFRVDGCVEPPEHQTGGNCTVEQVPFSNYMTTCQLRGGFCGSMYCFSCWHGTSANETNQGTCTAYHPPVCPDNNNNGICDKDEEEGGVINPGSPILVNLGQGPWRFLGAALFDLQGHGQAALWSWPDGQLAFLALDINDNGVIDNGRELFGDQIDTNGFERLRDFDSNHDGVVNPMDDIWPHLQLWLDANRNGVTDAGELTTVNESQIVEFSLDYHRTGRRDQSGNFFRYEALVTFAGGKREPYYDVYFRRMQ